MFGYKITKQIPSDFEKEFLNIYDFCKPYTMTSLERMYSLWKAVKYINKYNIVGDIVECGVWKGGSMMLVAKSLMTSFRKLWLYDTYEGMPSPGYFDIDYKGQPAMWFKNWCQCSLNEVKNNMKTTGYRGDINYIEGKVEDTIPNHVPHKISLLRLDTDFYESTKHELTHLYPKISVGGVIIIDDYGYWKGARKAVDEYFSDKPILFNRIDHTGIIGVKISN